MLDDELRNIITENRQAALQDELFLRELKFAFSSGPVDELLARCDVPAKELRFGRRSLLYLRPAVGDPLRVSGQLLRHHRGRARMTYSSIATTWLGLSLLATAQKAFCSLLKRAGLR